MAKMLVRCPSAGCGASYRLDESLRGKTGRCTKCRATFVVAAQTPTGTADGVPALWQPGDVILGLYEVKGVLGEGGMGKVYRARHKQWDLDLAVKTPRPEFLQRAGAAEDFEREAETWVNLGLHPHVVSCCYVRRIDELPRVFAEYVAGGSLHDWIRKRKLYQGGPEESLKRILDIAIQFAWGLHHAHEHGLVHQDVKPHNVMMTPDGVAKVTDFGLSRARALAGEPTIRKPTDSILVSSGGMTPAYSSPEQAEGRLLSRRTDIWSWAVSFLELLVGEVTWPSGTVAPAALEAYLEAPPDDCPVRELSPSVASLLRRCLQFDPEARPADMLDVAGILQDAYREIVGTNYPRQAPGRLELLADGLNNRAVSLLDLGKQQEAERAWEEALKAQPQHPEATYNLGLVRWRSAVMTDEELLHNLQGVARARPTEWLPRYLLGQVHMERGDCAAAVEVLQDQETAQASDEARALLDQAKKLLPSSRRVLRTLTGTGDGVGALRLSDDGRSAVTSKWDGAVTLWDTTAGTAVRTLAGHTEPAGDLGLSADGRCALSVSTRKTVKLWDAQAGTCSQTFSLAEDPNEVTKVSLGGAGFVLSAHRDGSLRLSEAATGRCLRTLAGQAVQMMGLDVSEDGRLALSAGLSDGTGMSIKLWDLTAGTCLRVLQTTALVVTRSRDGRLALSASGPVIKVWDLAGGLAVRSMHGHTESVRGLEFSEDGQMALSASIAGSVKLWDVSTGRCLRTLQGNTSGTGTAWVSWGDAGRLALVSGGDQPVRLWDMRPDWRFTAPFTLSRVANVGVVLAASTQFGHELALAHKAVAEGNPAEAAHRLRAARSQPGYERRDEALRPWATLYSVLRRTHLRGGWEDRTHTAPTTGSRAVCLSEDARHILWTDDLAQTLRVQESATGRILHTVKLSGQQWNVGTGCLGGDGRSALLTRSAHLQLVDLAGGTCLRTFEGHTKPITAVSWTRDGRFALSGSEDATVKLWDVATGRCLRTLQAGPRVLSVSWGPDGCVALSGSGDGTVRLWDVATGRCLRTFQGDMLPVQSVSWSADGRYAVTTGWTRLRLWEIATGRCLSTLEGHTQGVNAVSLGSDGRHALAAGYDGTVKLWDAVAGQLLCILQGHQGSATAVSWDGAARHVVSAGADRTARVWFLDWELEEAPPTDWDEDARAHLEVFLANHTPHAGSLPVDRELTEAEVALALTRRDKSAWTEEEFQGLLHTLRCAGHSGLRPEGVRQALEQMASNWDGPRS